MTEIIEVGSRNAAFDELRRGKVGKKEKTPSTIYLPIFKLSNPNLITCTPQPNARRQKSDDGLENLEFGQW